MDDIGIINSLRVMTTAYLFSGDSVLLMERSPHRSYLPSVWSGIGGHVEVNEFGNLLSACFREIEEETGLQSNNVESLNLKYVILRQRKHELSQQFVYFGSTTTRQIGTTDEGILYWIPSQHIFDYQMTDSNRMMLEHYYSHDQTDQVWVGTMHEEESQPAIHWALLSDWEKQGE